MWKPLRITTSVIASIILLLVWPIKAMASTTADVTITATGVVVGEAAGFTVYYISDYEVGITWEMPPSAENIMIRAAYGRYPDPPPAGTEPTDGYLVYYGTDTATSDTAVNLDETLATVCYRAWTQTAGGAWSPLYSQGSIESISMRLLAYVFLALALTGVAFWQRSIFLYAIACPLNITFGLFIASQSDAENYQWVLGVTLAIVGTYCLFKAVSLGIEDYRRNRQSSRT